MREWLRFVRLPNAPTAMADVFAGAACQGLPLWSPAVVVTAVGSGALYAGGIALNDVFDYRKDVQVHPDRALPRGVIRISTARMTGLLLLLIGALTGSASGPSGTLLAVALAAGIFVYDVLPERAGWIAAAVLGACRGMNLARGLACAAEFDPRSLAIPATHALMMGLVTLVSQAEEGTSRSGLPRLASRLLPWCYAAPTILALALGHPAAVRVLLPGGALLGWYVTRPAFEQPPRLPPLVPRAVFTLILVDAAYVLAAGDFLGALGVAALYPLSAWLRARLAQAGS